jgi:hypothetical protein
MERAAVDLDALVEKSRQLSPHDFRIFLLFFWLCGYLRAIETG